MNHAIDGHILCRLMAELYHRHGIPYQDHIDSRPCYVSCRRKIVCRYHCNFLSLSLFCVEGESRCLASKRPSAAFRWSSSAQGMGHFASLDKPRRIGWEPLEKHLGHYTRRWNSNSYSINSNQIRVCIVPPVIGVEIEREDHSIEVGFFAKTLSPEIMRRF